MNNRARTGRTPKRCKGNRPKVSAAAPHPQALRPLVFARWAVQTASRKTTRYSKISPKVYVLDTAHGGCGHPGGIPSVQRQW